MAHHSVWLGVGPKVQERRQGLESSGVLGTALGQACTLHCTDRDWRC